ncbi:MAG TPA: hypothetical protein VGD37_12260 [Kofleriaceae bacterium]
MKVLVIPEDPMLDQYILKPVVERLFADLGLSPRVDVLWNPRLRGVDQALDPSRVRHVVGTYSMFDLFLLTVDRDADEHRAKRARTLETEHPGRLFACLAIEEVEVWMLALHRDRLSSPWTEIRGERDAKERFAHPFLAAHAPKLDAGQGRKRAMRDLGARWKGLLEVCPEIAELKARIAAELGRRA